jgi:serine/threonine protein kinase
VDEVAFGRYRLIALIGEGAMGKVYKAHDTVIGRDVAIKVLPPELATEPGYEERFRREAHTAARLTEPHIIPIHDTGEIDGRLYLVMPVIEGVDVHSLLKREGPMDPQRAVHVIEQLGAALDAAHEAGLVHRDVKPSNALMTRRDFVYLIDFGIAHDAAATRLTSTGMMVGTMAYMAPERFRAGAADARADVYSLACVLYECLTGATPYPGDSLEQQIAGHLTLDPPQPSSRRPAIAGFDEVIAAGMAKSPDERYQSAHELATAAHHALTEAPNPARKPRPGPTLLNNPPRPAPAPSRRDDQGPPAPAPEPMWQQPTNGNLTAAQLHPPGRPPFPPPRPADWPPPQPPPQIGTPPPQQWGQRPPRLLARPQFAAIAAVAAVVVVLVISFVTFQVLKPHPAPSRTPAAQPAPPSGQAGEPVNPTMTPQPTSAAQPIKVGLYQQFQSASAVGPNGQPINATLAGQSYPSSTGMWVGCEGRPATVTYRLDHKFTELKAVVGLQPHTPDGLTAQVTISGDGQVLQQFTVGKSPIVPVDLNLNGMNSLVVAALRVTGVCTPASLPYGALGGAVLTQAGD